MTRLIILAALVGVLVSGPVWVTGWGQGPLLRD